ncbi:MAG: hypothetical protein K2M87_06100 [Muribaculaceae bacterium]|nr:hypothetical protein [Muribaculaceae bacterium]
MKMGEWYKRWRHTRGYGVHSPYAYQLVKDVIRPPRVYAYYGYEQTDNLARCGREIREARMLLRLVNSLRPVVVSLPEDTSECFIAAIRCAVPGAKLVHDSANADCADMLLLSGDMLAGQSIAELLAVPGRSLAVSNVSIELRRQIFDALPEGVLFYGKRNLIAVNRPYMQKIAISVRI